MQRNCLCNDLLCKEYAEGLFTCKGRQSSLDTSKRTKLNGSFEGCDLWEQQTEYLILHYDYTIVLFGS